MRVAIGGVIGEIDSFPGCSQIAISHSVYLPELKRGQGIGQKANELRQGIVFGEFGYDCLLCTVRDDNEAQKKILRANNWEHLTMFRSSKTGHVVELWACYADEWRERKGRENVTEPTPGNP